MQKLISFFQIFVWFSFRQVRTRLWQSFVVLIGVSLGAAVFTSVRLAVNASLESFTRGVDHIAGKADWSIVSPGRQVPEELVVDASKLDAVKAVSPLSSIYVQPVGSDHSILLIGIDPISDQHFRSWQASRSPKEREQATWLDLMRTPFSLIAGTKVLQKLQLQVGQKITVEHVQKQVPFTIVGELESSGLGLVEEGVIAITDLATFQEFTNTYGYVDRIDLILDKDDQPAAGIRNQTGPLERIQALLPDGIFLEHPSDLKETGRRLIRSYELNLSVLSFVSLFVGMFLIYSLVSLNVSSRRQELAILRSIGASERTVFLLFLMQGGIFGLLGWAVSIPIGSVLVRELLERVSATISNLFVRVQVERLPLDPYEIALSSVVTILVSLIAAWHPAYEAMRVSPRETFFTLPGTYEKTGSPRRLAFLGFLLLATVYPIIQMPPLHEVPLPGYIASFILFAGTSLLSPAVLRQVGSRAPKHLRRIVGESAYLGARYIRDAGSRAAISTAALITATALFVAIVIMVHSFRTTVEEWVSRSIGGDLYLRPKMAGVNRYRETLPNGVVEKVKELAGTAVVLPYRRIYLEYGHVPYQLEMIDFKKFSKQGKLLFMTGNEQELLERLAHGEGVVISEVFHNRTALSIGDQFQVRIGSAHLTLPVLGIFRDYRTQGGVVYYSLDHFVAVTGDGRWSGVRIDIPSSEQNKEELVSNLRSQMSLAFTQQGYGIELTPGEDLRGNILHIFDQTFAVTTVLLFIALSVAALGVASTLAVLVMDRIRHFYTIIAIGGTQWQIRSIVLWEALIMVLTGEVLGGGCGFLLSDLLIFVINRQSFGWTFDYSIDWKTLILSMPLILGVSLVAAVLAAQMVFRGSAAEVLREQ